MKYYRRWMKWIAEGLWWVIMLAFVSLFVYYWEHL